MLLVGSILALVSRLPKSAKSPVVIFTAVAITLCLSLFATAVLTQGSMVIAESAAMMAFWTVFILLLSLSATPPRTDYQPIFHPQRPRCIFPLFSSRSVQAESFSTTPRSSTAKCARPSQPSCLL